MPDLNADDRAMLAAVVMRQVIRNVIGNDEILSYPPEGGQPVYEVPDFDALRRLRDAGLIVLLDGRGESGERYWEITEKALEA